MKLFRDTGRVDMMIKLALLFFVGLCTVAILFSLFGRESTPGKAAGSPPISGPAPAVQGAVSRSGGRQEQAITVQTLSLSPQSIVNTIRLNGDVSSRSEISVFPDTAGRLVRYEVSVGSTVGKNDIIAWIDPSRPGAAYSQSPVRAPIAGTVISIPLAAGNTVTTGTAVATVGVLDDLHIITHVPEKYISIVRPGLPAGISLIPYPGEIFDARIVQVSPVVNASTRTVEIRLEVRDPAKKMRPGMFAVITLVTREERGVMVIPKTALRSYNNLPVVYVLDSDGRARRREVSSGLSSDTHVQLLDGVAFGETIILSASVSDGTLVRLAEDKK